MKKVVLIMFLAPVMAWGQKKVNFEFNAGGASIENMGSGFSGEFNIYGKVVSVINFGAGINASFYQEAPEQPVYSAFPEIRVMPKLSDKISFMFIGGAGKAFNAHRTYLTIGGGLKFIIHKNTSAVVQARYIQHSKKEVETKNGFFASLGISI